MRLYRNPFTALVTAFALGVTLAGCGAGPLGVAKTPTRSVAASSLTSESDHPFTVIRGTVTKLLPDDTHGNPHQLFLLKASVNGVQETVRCAHNTKLAPYVPLQVGDAVEIKGVYIQEKPHDVIHWTHYDPRGGNGGYILHQGKKYEKL